MITSFENTPKSPMISFSQFPKCPTSRGKKKKKKKKKKGTYSKALPSFRKNKQQQQ